MKQAISALIIKICFILSLMFQGQYLFAYANSPYRVVETTAEELLKKLEEKKYSDNNDVEYVGIVEEVLLAQVDFKTTAKFVMGKQPYLSANEAQRMAFQQVFQQSLVSTYSTGLSLLDGTNIEVLTPDDEFSDKKITGVSVLIQNRDGSVFPLRFTLRKDENGSWKIINVILNGYNVAYAYHRQFQEALKRYNGDLDRLIANWNARFSKPKQQQTSSKYKNSNIPGWKTIEFEGKTRYQQTDECVLANANASASGLIKEFRKPLAPDSKLHWSWKAEAALQSTKKAAEKSKAGDDFLARVYVIKEGTFPWQTKAINYVWSNEHEVGEYWPNPYVSNAIMLVVQSGEAELGQWKSFERDIKADFKKYHDMEVESIDAVALMTDTDQTGGKAEVCYRLPYFE